MKNLYSIVLLISLPFLVAQAAASVSPIEIDELKAQIINLYGKIIEEKGATLEINTYLISSNANAYSKKIEKRHVWEINIYGGMLQHPLINQAALGLIICHEVGHFLAGKPYVQGKPIGTILAGTAPKQMAAEGQADFFATSDCGKKLFSRLNLLAETNLLPPALLEACTQSGTTNKVCQSLIETAKRVSEIYVDLSSKIDGIQYDSTSYTQPDNSSVDQTLLHVGEYPSLQCRLDTMLAGLSCRLNSERECINYETNEVIELRPSCWYHR